MQHFRVGVVGATGMVGQRFIQILENHPWFSVSVLAASARSAGKPFAEAVSGRWHMITPIPASVRNMIVLDAEKDIKKIAEQADFVFCAVDMKKDDIRALEEAYAKAECPVMSNNSAHRWTEDVPMIIPEINAEHMHVVPHQRRRLGTTRGFIAVKSNCSIQSYVPALHALMPLKPLKAAVCTYQAISGAGKTFDTWPEMIDNVNPYIGGEEEKSEQEPLKVWGAVCDGRIVPVKSPIITAQCIRVPVTDGHMAAVFASFEKKAEPEEIIALWQNYRGPAQALRLPSAPKRLLHYFSEADRPQTRLDRNLENGMAVSIGRLRTDSLFDVRFVGLSHNTLRGAAGGNVLMAELFAAEGFFEK